MSGHSSIESLSPVSDAAAAAVFGAAGRDELLAGLTRLPAGRAGRPRPLTRRRLVLALAAMALVATATAATWVALRTAPARETTSVECVIHGVDAIIPSTSGDPAHDCAVEWMRELGTPAPPLRAYDNGFGGVTVLLRSVTPPANYKRLVSGQDADLIQLQNSLDDFVNGLNSSCLGSTAAASLARQELVQFGFTGWTVKASTAQSGGGTCWSSGLVDPSTQTVTLGAGSDQNGGTPTRLADKLRPLTQRCESLPEAVAAVRTEAGDLGLSESARGYDLNTVTDNSMRCASIYETVGGTIFLTVRGPRH